MRFESIPGPEFFHRDNNCIATMNVRSHPQHPASIGRGIHCLNRIVDQVNNVRIPMKPAMHSNLKPATCSDPKPAGVPI